MTVLSASEIQRFLQTLCEASERETLPRFRQRINVDNKLETGFDPVTEADREAERVMRALINEAYPDHGIMGEEFGSENPDADYIWVIDPIDGTRAFISGLPTWGTLVGLMHRGSPIAGCMHQPFTGETFLSDGSQSLLMRHGDSTKLTTRTTATLDQSIIMSTDPNLFNAEEAPRFEALMHECQLRRFGFDCYGYAMVASGQVDLVVESGLQSYDIAGLIPTIEHAGGVVTTWEGQSAAQGGQILAAANPQLHALAMEVLNPSR